MPYSKTSMDVKVQAPIGGWNTRDAFDDIAPTDAITMDNWLPGLGAVAVREGKTVHGVAVTDPGPDLVLNGDFELGSGETVPDWDTDFVFIDTVIFHSGTQALKLNEWLGNAEQEIACAADTEYVVTIWSIMTGPVPPSTSSGILYIDDITNTDNIITNFLPNSGEWVRSAYTFTTPPSCVLLRVRALAPQIQNSIMIIDDVTLNATGALVTEPVQTLMSYDSTTFQELISADNGAIRNSTAQGTPETLQTGFTSDIWDWTNFDSKLIMVNGEDAPQEYNGAAVTNLSPALVGPTKPIGCHAFKNRMYYWDHQSQDVWYTELHASAGTCTEFPLSRLTRFGGNLITVETWTMDGGTGPDDHLVFIMSSGEVIVYQGSSPASASNWALVGIYDIGVPLGPRCTVKFGPDLVIMTGLDIISLAKIIQGPEALAERSKVSGAMEKVVQFLGSSFFDAVIYPVKKVAVFTVPASGGENAYQLVQNLVTAAWCRFTGWNSYSWVAINDKIFFGGDFGTTYEAFNGGVDEYWNGTELVYNAIESELQTAWLTFGSDENKSVNAMKPIFDAVGDVPYNFAIATDFAQYGSVEFPAPVFQSGTPWYSPWYSPWGAGKKVTDDWGIVRGFGRFIGALFKFTTTTVVKWGSTIWHLEGGTRM